MDTMAVVNVSTVLTDAQVAGMVEACKIQLDQHFSPLWGATALLVFVPKGAAPPKGAWQVAVLDNADQAGVEGYHDVTIEGLPLAKVFAKTILLYGDKVSVALSHEILEMRADPDVNLLVEDAARKQRFWAFEAGDPVQADEYLVAVSSGAQVAVSNFVLPAYFQTFRRTGPFDYLKKLSAPVPAMTPGGYMIYVQNGAWSQVFATVGLAHEHGEKKAFRNRPHDGSRRQRRMLGKETWIRSTVPVA
jgi:hypothetical protein